MPILAALPILTAVAAGLCAVWPPARRFIWVVVALAAINVVLAPLTSGEWFYQHEEDPSYEQAVARGDFTSFDSLVGRHDPQLVRRMTALAVSLLAALVVLAFVPLRARSGVIVKGAVVLAAAALLIQSFIVLR